MDTNNLENEKQPVIDEKTDTAIVQPTVTEDETITDNTPEHQDETNSEMPIDHDVEVENGCEEAEVGEAEADTATVLLSIEDVIQKLRELLDLSTPLRSELNDCKSQFYNLLRIETEKQKQEFLAAGGDEVDFVAQESVLYTEGKDIIAKIVEKRAQNSAVEEAEKEKNVAKKQAIIDRIKELIEQQSKEDFNKLYQEFKALQQQWNEIKLVPQAKINELWKSYQLYVEKFYDLVRINSEFREYDFKKNLEQKINLCETAEKLTEKKDTISAFHQLQKLHHEWREIGPVARSIREEIWTRFKDASAVINKKYQAHFEEVRKKESENLALKTALCEQLEAIDFSQITTAKSWNKTMQEVRDIQEQWRKIGFAPKKWSNKIYDRYRTACNRFFKAKDEFDKPFREERKENLKKKLALCERVEALKESQEWQKTTQEVIDLQKEWKKIGAAPMKFEEKIWKRFISACDHFFEQKKQQISPQNEDEAKNLEAKKAIIEKINALDVSDTENATTSLRALMDEWYTIGYVPFRMKARITQKFQQATEAMFDKLNISKGDRKPVRGKNNNFKSARPSSGKSPVLRERDKLMQEFERVKNELQTYENNIGFLSVSSKKGNSLLDEMHQKVEKIKAELASIVEKIEQIDKGEK